MASPEAIAPPATAVAAEPAAGSARSPLPAVHERPWAVGVYLALPALVGLAWSAPLAAALGAVTGAYPRGDARLLEPGGVLLFEALRHLRASFSAIGAAWAVVALLALPLGLVALAFVLAQLAARGSARPQLALARAVRALPTLLAIGLVVLLTDAAVIALLMIGGGTLVQSSWPVPPDRDIARLGLYGVVGLAVLAVGVLHDLARAAAVGGPARAYVAMRAALRTASQHAGRATLAYTWRALAAVACIAAAAWLAGLIGHRTTGALVASTFTQQLGLAAAGWLRLTWLAQAVRLVQSSLPRRSPRDSAAPAQAAA